MNSALEEAIASEQIEVMSIFHEDFSTREKWYRYFNANYAMSGSSPSVENVLRKMAIVGDSSEAAATFHALFIACWVTYPIAKGSYTFSVPHEYRAGVMNAVQKLPSRRSSHVAQNKRFLIGSTTASGKDAYQGWKFFKGSDELLVQSLYYRELGDPEGKEDRIKSDFNQPPEQLFLKAESDHTQSAYQITKHGISWIASKLNMGSSAFSSEFQALMRSPNDYAIAKRNSEKFGDLESFKNYSKEVLKRAKALRGTNFRLNRAGSTITMRELLALHAVVIWINDTELKAQFIQTSGGGLFPQDYQTLYNSIIQADNAKFSRILGVFCTVANIPTVVGAEKQLLSQGLEGFKKAKQVVDFDTFAQKDVVTRHLAFEPALSVGVVNSHLQSLYAILGDSTLSDVDLSALVG